MGIAVIMFAFGAGFGAGALFEVWWSHRPEPPECRELFLYRMGDGKDAHLCCCLTKGHRGQHR